MDEQQRRYQQIRCVLKNLAAIIGEAPNSARAGHGLEGSQTYLQSHCAECGCALTDHDYAQVYAQERARVGAAGEAGIEEQAICASCYTSLRRALSAFAPALAEAQQPHLVARSLAGHDEITVSAPPSSCPGAAERPWRARIGRASRPAGRRASAVRDASTVLRQHTGGGAGRRHMRHGATPLHRQRATAARAQGER